MPGKRTKVVLRPNDVPVIQLTDDSLQLRKAVTHIVIRDDHTLVLGMTHSGKYVSNLPIERVNLGAEQSCSVAPDSAMLVKYL